MKPVDICWLTHDLHYRPDMPQYFQDVLALELYNETRVRFKNFTLLESTFDTHPMPCVHWSRVFEIPWVMSLAEFKPTDHVLEVGGSGTSMQFVASPLCRSYTNVDKTPSHMVGARACKMHKLTREHVTLITGDFREYHHNEPLSRFDTAISISTLEHDANPKEIVQLMLEHLMPGGRLVITMDVAETIGPESSITKAGAGDILNFLGLSMPPEPSNIVRADVSGIVLQVLCICAEKE